MKFKITIGRRLALGASATLLLMLAMALVSTWRLDAMLQQTKTLTDRDVERYALSMQWERNIAINATRAVALLKTSDTQYAAQLRQDMEKTTRRISEIQKQVESLIDDEEGRNALKLAGSRRAEYLKTRALLTRRKDAGETLSQTTITSELQPALDAYLSGVADVVTHEKTLFDDASERAHHLAESGRWMTLGLGAAAAVVAALFAWASARVIVRRVREVRNAVQQVAAGNLSVKLDAHGQDEVTDLMVALKKMVCELEGTVSGVRSAADRIAINSSEIAQGNADLSLRTEQQAGALEESAASMEELGSTVRQNAENATQANELAHGASHVAAKGGEVVHRVVETMREINDSSKQIADIIGLIDGIAFQTNILALNAAVEAARAGEQGRGFAVVAGEVRSLAQRTGEAAKEINRLITTSVQRVEHGSLLVDEAGATMMEVVSAIQRVTAIMGEISAASAEQSLGVAQVGEVITQMDHATQQNAALVEQSAAAAASLREQAQSLVDAVAVFRLKVGETNTRRDVRPARPDAEATGARQAIVRAIGGQSGRSALTGLPQPQLRVVS